MVTTSSNERDSGIKRSEETNTSVNRERSYIVKRKASQGTSEGRNLIIIFS